MLKYSNILFYYDNVPYFKKRTKNRITGIYIKYNMLRKKHAHIFIIDRTEFFKQYLNSPDSPINILEIHNPVII